MSWSASTTTSVANAATAIPTIVENPQSNTAEQAAQVAAAKVAALSLAQSGAVVGSTGSVCVNISGHANPGHQVTPGYAYDTITITISQQPTSTGDN